MGGIGSGRLRGTGSRSLTTDFLKLDSRTWRREGLLSEGQEFTWVWPRQELPAKAVKVKVGDGEFALDFFARTQSGSPYWVRQTINFSVACGSVEHDMSTSAPAKTAEERCVFYILLIVFCAERA